MCGKFLHFKTGHRPVDVNLCNIFVHLCLLHIFNKEDQNCQRLVSRFTWTTLRFRKREHERMWLFPCSESQTQPHFPVLGNATLWALNATTTLSGPSSPLCLHQHQCIQLWWLQTLLSCHSSADASVQTGLWPLHPTKPTDEYDGHKLESAVWNCCGG